MLYLMNLEKITQGIQPVTSTEIFVKNSLNFHDEGLFSESIFGALNTSDRRKKFSYIDLHCKVLHPAVNVIVKRLNRKILDFISSQKKFKMLPDGTLEEDDKGDLTGYSKFIEIFPDIKFRGDTSVREAMINMLHFYYKNNMLFIDKCYVIPPKFRDIKFNDDGSFNMDGLNDYYIDIIKLSEQLLSAENVMYDILSYKMHILIQNVYEYISKKISKKEGLIRSNLLGKRVDFSARAVISGAAAELEIDEIGVPFHLLVQIFEPFLIHTILYSNKIDKQLFAKYLKEYNGSELSVISLQKLFKGIYKHDEISENLKQLLIEAINLTIEDKIVLTKRDPALHAESVEAFKPKLIEGYTIKLNPLICSAYNADFDGDQMALYIPLTEEAIQEAKEKMIITKNKNSYQKIVHDFSKDIVVGIYMLTKESNKKQTNIRKILSYNEITDQDDVYERIYFGGIETTIGRIIFNEEILPKKYEFINEEINKKKLKKIALDIHKNYDFKEYKRFCKKILEISFKYSSILSRSFTFEQFKIPKYIEDLKNKIEKLSPEKAQKYIDKMTKEIQNYCEKNNLDFGDFGKAGALKNDYDQVRQVLVSKGLIQSPSGEILSPIKESYSEGLSPKSFFITGSGTRKGIIDRVLNTATTGYISRQLVYATQRCELDPSLNDCKTKRFLKLKVTKELAERLKGRYVVEDKKIISFNEKTMIDKIIKLRSPVYCTSPKICLTCYGDLFFDNGESPFIGVLAAHQIGECVTQAIMRTFHIGGAVSLSILDFFKYMEKFLSENELNKLKKYLNQKNTFMETKVKGELFINKKDYLEPDKDIHITKDAVILEYGYFILKINDEIFDLAIDNKVEIDLTDKVISIEKNQIKIDFDQNCKIFELLPVTDNFGDKVQILRHLLSGKKPYKNVDHYVLKFYELFSTLTDADLVHMEVIISQLVRDRNNPTYPARLNKKEYNPFIGNLKDISSYESWLSAVSFENFNKSITTGLLYDNDLEPSVLEKLLKGEL